MTGLSHSKSRKGSVTARPAVQHLSIIKENDFWETPKDLLWSFFNKHQIFPRLDVCTTKSMAERHGFPRYFTRKQSALKQEWDEDFFMNCPYTRVAEWVAYAIEQVKKHGVNGVILSFSKTDTKWWHKYIENNPKAEVHFVEGRIKFHINGKPSKNSAPYPSCWIILRGTPWVKTFATVRNFASPMPNPEHAIQ